MPAYTRRFTLLLVCLSIPVFAAAVPLIVDGDGDMVSDEIDDCPYTHPGISVDARGCPLNRQDGDSDGVTDEDDSCPYTTAGAIVDVHGCAIDSDFDGVANGLDYCPQTQLSRMVDMQGCSMGDERVAVVPAASRGASKVLRQPVEPQPGWTARSSHTESSTAESPRLLVKFSHGSVRLGSGDRAAIKAYARFFARRLAADPQLQLVLKASADRGESQAAALAVARIVVVRRQLVELGINIDRIDSEKGAAMTRDQSWVEVVTLTR